MFNNIKFLYHRTMAHFWSGVSSHIHRKVLYHCETAQAFLMADMEQEFTEMYI